MIRYAVYLTKYEANRAYKMQHLYNQNNYEQSVNKITSQTRGSHGDGN